MDSALATKISDYCLSIEAALASGDIPLVNDLIDKRLTALKSLEASVDKTNPAEFSHFRDFLLKIEQDDRQQLEKVQVERRKLHSVLHKQTKTTQAVSAYTKVKFQK